MKNRIGEKYITNEGYEIEIIEYFGWNNCTIKFNNNVTIKNREYANIVKGNVKNPYHKSVFGVGYFGIGKYGKKIYPKMYQTWRGMLERCYDSKYQEKKPTYIGCSVVEEWHDFQNFAQWYEDNWKPHMDGWHLDKDILVKGNKIYSPTTCCFVPKEINGIFIKRDLKRGKYPIGVCKKSNKFIAQVNINGKSTHLGYFNTPEEAFQAYKTAKENHIKELTETYKEKIIESTYIALINYKVEITD